MADTIYPTQIQADNQNAEDGQFVSCMVHVFDIRSEITAFEALSKVYLHVVSWDVNGSKVREYDNR